MTLTREPSGRRASQIGLEFVDAAADLADDALADVQQLLVVAEADAGLLDLAVDFDVDLLGAVHHDVGDVVARQQRLKRTVAEHVVADVLEQLLLLGDRHREVLDRDDVVDDVADFLAGALRIELGELRQVDRVDQRGKDLRLGVVVGFGASRCCLRAGSARRRLDRLAAQRGGRRRRLGAGRCSAAARAPQPSRSACRPACGGATGGRNSGAVRTPSSLPLLPNMTAYHRHRNVTSSSASACRAGCQIPPSSWP